MITCDVDLIIKDKGLVAKLDLLPVTVSSAPGYHWVNVDVRKKDKYIEIKPRHGEVDYSFQGQDLKDFKGRFKIHFSRNCVDFFDLSTTPSTHYRMHLRNSG